MISKEAKIYLAGHRGMVGSAILRHLVDEGFENIITRSHNDLDLCSQTCVHNFMKEQKPDYVILAAAKVGGIHANNEYPAEFIYQNLLIEANAIHGAYISGCRNLLFLGSSCIYPKFANQPMAEQELLTGPLESTNEPYAIAKIAGIKLCESYNRQYDTDYRSVMPTNLYGPNDNFHPENSHVVPALIRRFHEAKFAGLQSIQCWGSGSAKREFLHVDDMARACLHIMQLEKSYYLDNTETMLSHINIGTGKDVTIKELAESIAEIVGYTGEIAWDTTKPDGTPRKLIDVKRIESMGWQHQYGLKQGLQHTYSWFIENQESYRQ